MTEREDIQKRRRALKDAYSGLYEEVAAILFRRDPIGINFEDNTDEYEPEVDTILPRLAEACDAKDACRIIHEEFVRWFSVVDAGAKDVTMAIMRAQGRPIMSARPRAA